MLDHDDTREPACTVLDCEPDHANHLACPRVWPLRRLINRHLDYVLSCSRCDVKPQEQEGHHVIRAPNGRKLGLCSGKSGPGKNKALICIETRSKALNGPG